VRVTLVYVGHKQVQGTPTKRNGAMDMSLHYTPSFNGL
jgi:hypothetical protein